MVQLGHDARQYHLGGGGAESQEQFVLDVDDEPPEVDPREEPGDDRQNADEQQRGGIAGGDELAVAAQRADSVLAHDVGHRAKRPMMVKKMWLRWSMNSSTTGGPDSPNLASAKPNSTAKNST
ncbi:Uncharacterised protein [Mycobacteroides abscessus subsp. abscessus]|nr:Uncharacterised protein [Mycobacteroides abscessus subsp. abscessus]